MKIVRMMWSKTTRVLMATALLGVMASCKNDGDDMPAPKTVTDIVLENNDFSILRAAVVHAGLGDALRAGTLTVFAPNDAAFKASGFADAAAVTALPAATIKTVLEYHVLGSRVGSTDIATGNNQAVRSLAGLDLFVTRNTAGVSINGVNVIATDIAADNGVIHVVDRVILPPTQNLLEIAQGNPAFTYLVAAATRAASNNPTVVAALTSNTAAFTVFAPTNDAFIAAGFPTIAAIQAADPAVLAAVVLYHVVPGRVFSTNLTSGTVATAATTNLTVDLTNGVRIIGRGNNNQAANVVQANLHATNGVVHVINRVLLP
jgi:uncharacterized surface protein with fasciclin (FAS1) repeats